MLHLNLMAKMSTFIKDVAKELQINKQGYRLITNVKEFGGQEVKHLHFSYAWWREIRLLLSF